MEKYQVVSNRQLASFKKQVSGSKYQIRYRLNQCDELDLIKLIHLFEFHYPLLDKVDIHNLHNPTITTILGG